MEVVHVKITGEFHYVYDYFVLKVPLEIKGGIFLSQFKFLVPICYCCYILIFSLKKIKNNGISLLI